MNWVLVAAGFFIVWWITLFAVLPFSLRTQQEDGEVTLGTVKSAPRGPHVRRAMLRTTAITVLLFVAYYIATEVYGIGIDDLPRFVPEFG